MQQEGELTALRNAKCIVALAPHPPLTQHIARSQVAQAEAGAAARSAAEGVQSAVAGLALAEGDGADPAAARYLSDSLDALQAFAGVSGRPARLIQVLQRLLRALRCCGACLCTQCRIAYGAAANVQHCLTGMLLPRRCKQDDRQSNVFLDARY